MNRDSIENGDLGRRTITWMFKLTATLGALGVAVMMATAANAAEAKMKHPDFSGIWLGFAVQPSAGLGPRRPELSDKGKAMIQDFQDKYGKSHPESGAYCVPDGMPSMMTNGLAGYPIEFIQRPDRLVTISEDEMQVRRIFFDGRKQPEGYPPTRAGFSTAHWDGNTLVVETSNFLPWPSARWPRSSDAKITERISMTKRDKVAAKNAPFVTETPVGDDVLVDEMTIDDPVFTAPAKMTVYYQRAPDDDFLEYDCPRSLWQDALDAAVAARKGGAQK
jgi:hypothetical protein